MYCWRLFYAWRIVQLQHVHWEYDHRFGGIHIMIYDWSFNVTLSFHGIVIMFLFVWRVPVLFLTTRVRLQRLHLRLQLQRRVHLTSCLNQLFTGIYVLDVIGGDQLIEICEHFVLLICLFCSSDRPDSIMQWRLRYHNARWCCWV